VTGHEVLDAERSVPSLLRAARTGYATAVSAALREAGFDDLPRNGPFVLAEIANRGTPTAELIRQLRISRQAASQLIDSLVVLGYLDRQVDPADRRRVNLLLTVRGREAAAAVRAGVRQVDADLAAHCAPDVIRAMRDALAVLAELGGGDAELAR
jgi:DNA-binding MarR family transcriptional regulator